MSRRKPARELLQSLRRLRCTVEAERARIARDLAGRLAAPPGATGAYSSVLSHLEAEILALETDLAAAEDAYLEEKPLPAKLRRRRNAAFAELYETHGPLRRLLATFPDVRCAGFVAQTPRDPRALVAEAEDTVEFLRRLEGDPPPPSRGVSIKPGVVATALEAKCRRLGTGLDELEAAELEVRVAREEAEAALARAERVGPWVVQAIEGLAGLAGVGRESRESRR